MSSKPPRPPYERKLPEGIPADLPPEVIERLIKLQGQLTDFILHLIQALLRTGYYTPEHPESKRAKEGLYQQFKEIFQSEEDELTFLIQQHDTGQEILVEGVLPEAQRLHRLMMKGMGELYVPKFAKYLERKDLICMTLKSRIGQAEFTRFIDVMNDPARLEIHRKEEKEHFTRTLYEQGIFNVSFVFNEEMLGLDREMPWRARLALSRMRKDLRMIPYFQKTSDEEQIEIGRNLIRDAIRSFRQPDLLYAILQNSDIASSSQNPEEAIEDVIVAFLQPLSFIGMARVFAREHLALKRLQRRDRFEQKSDRLLGKIVTRLKGIGSKDAETLLEEFFRNNLIGLDDLTPELKNKILLERLTDKFLTYTQTFFQRLDQAREKETFLTLAQSFVKMIPELIRRERYPEVLRIVETLKVHFHQNKMWALLAGHILEEIGKGPIPHMLEEKFLTGKKEVRAAIIPIFAALEIGAIPNLINVLKMSKDQWVRKNACEALIHIGPVAAVHLLMELEHEQISIETTCDILRVLGEIKSAQWKEPLVKLLRRYVSQDNPRLREQALHTLCNIAGKEGEEIFLACLKDPDPEVQRRAIWCLGMIKSPKGVQKILGILKQVTTTPSPHSAQLETQIYHTFGLSGNLTIEGKTLEKILLEVLEKRAMKPWWGLLDKNPLSDASLIAIIEALGRMGTRNSIPALNRIGKSREGDWVSRVNEAVRKIESREGGPET